MKKLFTLSLVLLMATAGYSQVRKVSSKDALRNTSAIQTTSGRETPNLDNVESMPNMVRSEAELDYSTYDWQTNSAARTWTHTWPDGKVTFAYTISSDGAYSDRGTCIANYDVNTDEWTTSNGRVEAEKTGFGSIAQYGQNGIVIAAHTATDLGIYIVEDKDDLPSGSVSASLYTGSEDYTHPAVMTSGANRQIIHVLAAAFQATVDGMNEPIKYWRSSDGGQSWDKECVTIPFLTSEYGLNWGTNTYYFMETRDEDNCLAFVINNSWSDGMVIYSYDDGETWDRIVFYSHPNINGFWSEEEWFFYPRYTSAVWGMNNDLSLVYEFNGSRGDASSEGSYFSAIGGVGFWSESLPYNVNGSAQSAIPGNLTPGEPFVLDTAYLYNDIYSSLWLWSDAIHEMWPEYVGYLTPLDATHNPEDPYTAEEFNISSENFDKHGGYNGGMVEAPVLCVVPGSNGFDLVAIWSAMDENHVEAATGNYFMKLFARHSADGGRTWGAMKHLTNSFLYQNSECIWVQAGIVDNTLVVACQMDGGTGSYTVANGDIDMYDNYYQGMTFDLNELFPNEGVGVVESKTTKMNIYPNPASEQLNVNLSQGSEITVFNMMGQMVCKQQGHVGHNTIDLSNLSSGVYFINAGTATQKFVVK